MESRTTLRSNTEALRKAEIHNACITAAVTMLNGQWDLGLQVPNPADSPNGRKDRGTIEGRCVNRITVLQFKERLQDAIDEFRGRAKILYTRWVHKPRAERGVVPMAERSRPHPVSPEERIILLNCLWKVLSDEMAKIPGTTTPGSFSRQMDNLDDTPIRSQLPKVETHLKRQSDDFQDVQQNKKQKQPDHSHANDMPPPSNRPSRVLDPNTSIMTEIDLVFSPPASLRGFDSNETQTTAPDEEWVATQPNSPLSPTVEHLLKHPQSSKYGGSNFDDLPQNDIDSFCVNPTSFAECPNREMLEESRYEESSWCLNDTALDFVAGNSTASELYDRLKNVFRKVVPI